MEIYKLGSKGTELMKIQAVLKKIGYNPGMINGVFTKETENAVKEFQKNTGLNVDGIIGKNTYEAMEKFIKGYDVYTVKKGDTLYSIGKNFSIEPYKIILANPNVKPFDITPGEKLIVPFNFQLIDTNINYTYDILKRDLDGLKIRYPFITVASAGKSVLGRELFYVKLGQGPNEVFYNGSHHALEWITTPLLMKFIENFSEAYSSAKAIRGYDISDIWAKSTIYIMPMVNPDGVDLVINGLKKDNPYYNDLIKWNKGSSDFSKDWEANNRGVDLNHNYNASWELSKKAEKEYGVFGPGPTRYSGPSPESEPETKTVVKFTKDHNFRLVLAYHSQGEVIYWKYMDLTPSQSQKIGEIFSKVSGYALAETSGITSYAGYKDWFIQDFRRPGYTIEVGKGKNPLPITQLPKIYDDNEELLILAAII